jgi:5-hydroxyisourate hydrolase
MAASDYRSGDSVARISTHVLDTVKGGPAAGIRVDLYRIDDKGRERCATAVTDADGRTKDPLLSSDRIAAGVYEIVFAAGDYLRNHGFAYAEPLFLDEIVIRFGVSDEIGNYHVPLLLAPHGYSTYRGS